MIAYNEITTLFVSPNGGSGTSGTERTSSSASAPLPSLEAAFSMIAGLRRVGVGQPITVRLLDGIHTLSRTVKIGPAVTRVTVEPDPGANVRVIGGLKIDGWEWDTYNGVKCLSAPLPGAADFTDFYVSGERAKLTRYPEEGWLYPEDVENHEGQLFSSSKWFIAREGDIRDFKNIDRVQISFCHYWIDEHTPIEGYDPASRRVTFLYPSRFNIDGGRGTASGLEYCLENVAETFGHPDEWYADGGRIYYVPRDDSITPETIEAFIPRIAKLFEIEGTAGNPVKNIRFRGLRMGVTRGEYGSVGYGASGEGEPVKFASDAQAVAQADGSVSFRYAANCSVEDCALENYGVHGFVIGEGCHGIRILRTLMRDGGAGGVKIIGGPEGSPEATHTYGNAVEDCTILSCGRRYFAACGVLLIHTYENSVSHNEIGDLYYTGISAGWVWGYAPSISRDNRIEKNHIHHLGGGMLSDMGGVYLLGAQPGTVVSGNVIHHVKSKNYGGWALYTDEGSSFITLENNICYECSDNSYHQHYGSMNTVRNNVFAFAHGQEIRVSRTEPHLSILFENNILFADRVPLYEISREQIAGHTVSAKRNILTDCTRGQNEEVLRRFGDEQLTLADFQAAGMEYESISANPLFEDPYNYNFTLKPESPAPALGFLPIDTSDVGPRTGKNGGEPWRS
ncbi:MAG: right-handed parallel beta-helix repeat-containing protein [Clostridia bacterium]|nr:right-handed parallel beta-helix repeat-containing protein [Clostridia bacterium]